MTAINAHGRRIGEGHPRATISDHDVALIFTLLDERAAALEQWKASGLDAWQIDNALALTGLSYRLIADRFDIDKSTVFKIASGARRNQIPGID
ncbi:hypothetical protein CDEF62S_04672 [Castellaniella defragrans]